MIYLDEEHDDDLIVMSDLSRIKNSIIIMSDLSRWRHEHELIIMSFFVEFCTLVNPFVKLLLMGSPINHKSLTRFFWWIIFVFDDIVEYIWTENSIGKSKSSGSDCKLKLNKRLI